MSTQPAPGGGAPASGAGPDSSRPDTGRPVPIFRRAGYHTVFDNALLDLVLPSVSANAWKVLSLIVRATVGFQRDASPTDGRGLSIPRIQKRAGIRSKTTVKRALAELCDEDRRGGPLVLASDRRDGTRESFSYALNRDALVYPPEASGGFSGADVDKFGEGGQKMTPGGSENDPGGGSENDPLETKPLKQKKKKGAFVFSDVENSDLGEDGKPLQAAVFAYFHERAKGSEADRHAAALAFWERHETTGWVWKGEPVASWRTLAAGWLRRKPQPGTGQGSKASRASGGDPGASGAMPFGEARAYWLANRASHAVGFEAMFRRASGAEGDPPKSVLWALR